MWENSDDYGVLELVKNINTTNKTSISVLKKEISIYPNPSVNKLNIEFVDSYSGTIQIKIINILGDQMMKSVIYKGNGHFSHCLKVDRYPAGIYLLEVLMGNSRTTLNFQKQ
jgi:hypothetical protein